MVLIAQQQLSELGPCCNYTINLQLDHLRQSEHYKEKDEHARVSKDPFSSIILENEIKVYKDRSKMEILGIERQLLSLPIVAVRVTVLIWQWKRHRKRW